MERNSRATVKRTGAERKQQQHEQEINPATGCLEVLSRLLWLINKKTGAGNRIWIVRGRLSLGPGTRLKMAAAPALRWRLAVFEEGKERLEVGGGGGVLLFVPFFIFVQSDSCLTPKARPSTPPTKNQ